MVRFTKSDRVALHKLHLITGKSVEECRELFEGFLAYVVLCHMDGKPAHIPLVGDLSMQFNGMDLQSKGREANISYDMEFDSLMKRVVGQVENDEPNDVEEMFLRKIKNVLESFVE